MLITPSFTDDDDLMLDAFSFDIEEVTAIKLVLLEIKADFDQEGLAKDPIGRIAVRFTVRQKSVSKLQDFLGIRFLRVYGGPPVVKTEDGGASFRCEEIEIAGRGEGCVTMQAGALPAARVKCALIAHEKGWFGGVAKSGKCSK